MAKKESSEKIICQNKAARLNYFIDDTFEAGIVLVGTEVKSLREGRANLKDGYAIVNNEKGGMVDMIRKINPGQGILVRLWDGRLHADVTRTEPDSKIK